MKKLMFLMVMALMPMAFASCGGDDDYDTQSDRIVGVWKETYYWHDDTHSFRGWMGIGFVHEFKPGGKYLRYNNSARYERGEPDKEGTYSFDGTYLVLDGGFKRKVTFSENGKSFEWEQTAILEKY